MATKSEAIQRISNGEQIKKVVENLGVGTVTIRDWKRKRKYINVVQKRPIATYEKQ